MEKKLNVQGVDALKDINHDVLELSLTELECVGGAGNGDNSGLAPKTGVGGTG